MIEDIGMELSGSEETPAEEVPAVEETPSEEKPAEETPPAEEAPAEEVPAEAPAEAPAEETPPAEAPAEVILYDTPDGRKVTAKELQKEWKENFLPEFTKKSQRLAEIDREKNLNNPEDVPYWKKPDYVPKDYAELIEIAEKKAIDTMQENYQKEQDKVADFQKQIDGEIATIKETDKDLDENALFQHANKYGFKDLSQAYQNMQDMKKNGVAIEQRTVKNIKKRDADPISTGHGGEAPDESGYDPAEMSQFDGANEYLEHLKGNK